MSMDDVLKFLFFVPTSLRKPVALAILLLSFLSVGIAIHYGYSVLDAAMAPLWLAAFGITSVVLLVLSWLRRANVGIELRIVWTVVWVALTGGSLVLAHQRYAYEYNPLGFYQSRAWSPSVHQPGDISLKAWEWQITAVQDMSQTPFVMEMRATDACPVVDFQPVIHSVSFRPTITDVSEDSTRSTRWRVEDFRRPAEVVFRFVTKMSPAGTSPPCRPQITIWKHDAT